MTVVLLFVVVAVFLFIIAVMASYLSKARKDRDILADKLQEAVEALNESSERVKEPINDTPTGEDSFLELAGLRNDLLAAKDEVMALNEIIEKMGREMRHLSASNASLRGVISRASKKKSK